MGISIKEMKEPDKNYYIIVKVEVGESDDSDDNYEETIIITPAFFYE